VSAPLEVPVCPSGHAVFPPRLLCPLCGRPEWESRPARAGTVEETTRLAPSGVRLAAVRTDLGPRVIVRLADHAAAGDAVVLCVEDGAPVARRAGTA
jgi:uncharacterized OB-fold protein